MSMLRKTSRIEPKLLFRISLACLLVLFSGGCVGLFSPRAQLPDDLLTFIERAPVVYLHAIDPESGYVQVDENGNVPPEKPASPSFLTQTIGGFNVIGSVRLDDRQRDEVLASVTGALREDIIGMKCFTPYVALEARNGTNSAAMLFAFKCRRVSYYRNGKKVGWSYTMEYPEKRLEKMLK